MEPSVIISTLDDERVIERLIAFLQRELHGIAHELIVEDRGSKDGIVDVAEKADATVVRYTQRLRV